MDSAGSTALTEKEAKWILDGDTDFPERLLN